MNFKNPKGSDVILWRDVVLYWRLLKAATIDKKIICMLEKDNSFFVFVSHNDCIVSVEETNCFKSAEKYYQTLIKKYETDEKCTIELKI